jgi:hypothetical protein
MRAILYFARNCWVRTEVWDGALSWWCCQVRSRQSSGRRLRTFFFLSNCHLGDIRIDRFRRNFMHGILNRWALCYVFKMSECRFPSEPRLSSVSGVWHGCLTAQYSDGFRPCRSVARGTRDLSLFRNAWTGCGAQPASYSVLPEIRAAGTWYWLPGLIRDAICQLYLAQSCRGAQFTH